MTGDPTDGSRRIAILGGGIASLATAWRLSADPSYRITVYQRGWRLGGKGASSRGPNGRIEEHGLHVWLGYYDNAFRLMRECYEELDRPNTSPHCPIQTWTDAFKPADAVGLTTRSSAAWDDWLAVFTPNGELPGDPEIATDPMTPLEFVVRSRRLLQDFCRSLPDQQAGHREAIVISTSSTPPTRPLPLMTLATQALDAAVAASLEMTHQAASAVTGLSGGGPLVDLAVGLLEELRTRLAISVATDTSRRRMFELIDLTMTSVRGVLADGLLVHPRGFAAANGEEYRDWLARHGAAEQTFDSPLIHGVYDLVFGFRDGDPERPSFAAGTGLFLSCKIFFDYKGSIFWKMQAGMGDVVFAPLYEALRARGVRFEFFHEVDELVLSDDGQAIERVRLVRQAALCDGVDEYQPLADFDGLECFPAQPDQSQLASPVGDLLGTEQLWGRPRGSTNIELGRAVDFDVLVLGIPLGMAPHICSQLIEANPAWRDMSAKVGTVATQAAQLWLRSSERQLGWSRSGSTITGYVKPFDTVSSMSHLLAVEGWPGDDRPGSIIYVCNTLPEGPPPGTDAVEYPNEQHARVRRHALDFLERDARHFLPAAYSDQGFTWDELVGAGEAVGRERFDSQFWSANVDPSDRYVQSLPASDRFRLRPDQSGYTNLVLAGDWTDCGLNAGCIEAAVISGLQAANAIIGDDRWSAISGYWTPLAKI